MILDIQSLEALAHYTRGGVTIFFVDMKRRIEANADKTTPEKLLNLANFRKLRS